MKVLKKGLIVTTAALALVVGTQSTLLAQSIPTQQRAAEHRDTAQQKKEEMQITAEERKEAAKTRLQEAKLHACQNREKAITNIMVRLADRGQKHLDLFTTIADRTKTFYSEQGLTLANYDTLLTDVNAKQASAQATVNNVVSLSTAFDCEGNDPRGVAQSFHSSLQTEIEALQAYRLAVKNLIKGVKSARQTQSENREQ